MKMIKLAIILYCIAKISFQNPASNDVTGSNDSKSTVDAVAYSYASNSKVNPDLGSGLKTPKIVQALEKGNPYDNNDPIQTSADERNKDQGTTDNYYDGAKEHNLKGTIDFNKNKSK